MGTETVSAEVGTAADAPRLFAADAAVALDDDGAAGPPCQSCGGALVGEFCHRCGEKRAGARDLTLRHFVAEAAQEFTSVEHSKLFRTLRALLLRPGFLTLEWAAGRRNLYLKPLNLCLLILTFQVFIYSTGQVSTFDFGRIIEAEKRVLAARGVSQPQPVYDRLVEGIAAERRLSRETVLERINERWSRNVSLSQVPLILAYALLLQLFYLFSRRHFVEHVVFSLHYIAFTSLTVVLMWPVYYAVGITPTAASVWVIVGKFLLDIVYLFVAVRAFYRDSAGWALFKAPALLAAYFVIYVVTYLATLFASIYSVARW